MKAKPRLNSQDVFQLKAYLKFTRDPKEREFADYLSTLKVIEGNLSSSALHWVQMETSAALEKELARWHAEYKIEHTSHGYRARRFIKNRREYAKSITASGMDSQQVKRFQTFYRA